MSIDNKKPSGQPEVKAFQFALNTDVGKLPAIKLAVPEVPMHPIELFEPFLELYDGVVELAIKKKAAHEGGSLACKKGCSVCCKQMVPLSIPEILHMMVQFAKLESDHQKRIVDRFQEHTNKAHESGLLEKVFGVFSGTHDYQGVAKEYFLADLPCPFLEDGACSIHSFRPFACREYNVTSDPSLCASPFENKIDRVEVPFKMTTTMVKLAQHLWDESLRLIPMLFLFEAFGQKKGLLEKRYLGTGLMELMLDISFKDGRNKDKIKLVPVPPA